MARSKKAWANVAKGGVIDTESVRLRKSDVDQTIFDEDTGAKVRRVRVLLADAYAQKHTALPVRMGTPYTGVGATIIDIIDAENNHVIKVQDASKNLAAARAKQLVSIYNELTVA